MDTFGYTLDTMNTTTIHIKTDVRIRDDAKKVAEDSGYSLTSLINALLRQIARTKSLNLNLEEKPNKHAVAMLKKSEEDYKAGRVTSFESWQEVLNYLDHEIANEKQTKH